MRQADLLTSTVTTRGRKRVPKDPTPRFRPPRLNQLDAFGGSIEFQVPKDHLARKVWAIVERLDTGAVERKYSALGRRGYHPKRLLAVWVYASLIRMHHSTQVERACRTDAAFKWLCGGDAPSGPTLRRMRMKHAALFAAAIEQTVAIASERGLVDIEALAIDGVRLRAHAAMSEVRTVSRSKKRLAELAKVDASKLDEDARTKHAASVQKHQTALAECERRGTTSFALTNELAALMKFPSGGSAPAHRATVIATGTKARFVIGVLVDASPNDCGKLGEAVQHARQVLERLGLRDRRMVAAADAGYFTDTDLQFCLENREWVDLLVAGQLRSGLPGHLFGREHFKVDENRRATCPAGVPMFGPYPNDKEGKQWKWVGVGCGTCALKPQCTEGRERSLNIDFSKERAREAMHERFARPAAKERYNQRIATVEPVFSYLEDAMGFRRSSSRHAKTVVSEVLLKILSYNVARLIAARRLSCVLFSVGDDGLFCLVQQNSDQPSEHRRSDSSTLPSAVRGL
jgi:transposase